MRKLFLLGLLAASGLFLSQIGCSASSGSEDDGTTGSGGSGAFSNTGTGNNSGFGNTGNNSGTTTELPPEPTCEHCDDFPADPIIEDNADTSLFTGTPSGTGPCIIEPQDGSLFPRNWLRPRVNVSSPSSNATYQLIFHADRENNDLVVYTKTMPWPMPKAIWTALATNVMEEDVTVTVRVSTGSTPSESQVKFRIAPVSTGGTIVFWHATSNQPGLDTSALYGFRPGDEGVISALTPAQIQTPMYQTSGQLKGPEYGAAAGEARCVGCHTSTPDGSAVTTTDHWPWNIAASSISDGAQGQIPSFVTEAGRMMAQSPWQGVSTFSLTDWDNGNYRYVTSFAPRTTSLSEPWNFWAGDGSNTNTGKDNLVWINLASAGSVPESTTTSSANGSDIGTALINLMGTGWGIIARNGDGRGAVTPDWSHDGTKVAYTSTDSTSDGRVGPTDENTSSPGEVDIYTVPFGNGAGGTATPVQGASDTGIAEYYPDFSPDDQFIAYNRVGNMKGRMYYRKDSEVYLVPAAGGTARRLVSNDPPQCTNLQGDAIYNSWPRWSHLAKTVSNTTYYFYIFSSTRYSTSTIPGANGSTIPASELFLATVKVASDGTITDYPAIYLYSQRNLIVTDPTTNTSVITDAPGLNITPAWDDFAIPPVPPVEPPH